MSSLQTNAVTAVAPQATITTPQTTQPASVHPAPAADSSVESFERLQSAIQSATTWLNDYQSIDPESACTRKWKPPQDTRPSIEVIKLLPDHQKPHLPAGHIWYKDGNDLMILRHRATPSQIFQIYLFGPDHNQTTRDSRIQYIVSEKNMPIHGFANAKKEGFSTALRNEYPMSPESYKKDGKTFWRGHIIDYQDTLGLTTDPGISTRLAQNYKPEPEGTWARNLRADLVEKTREVRGSYSELQFYDFELARTNGGTPIPNSIFMETFDYSKDRVKGYDVPKSHGCHHWEKTRKNFCKNSLQLLENGDTFPTLVVTKDQLPVHRSIITMQDFPAEYGSWTFKMGYQIRQIAELEFKEATYKLHYCLFGQAHQAPIHTLQFWLGRAVLLATAIDTAYQSKVPPFQLHLTNTVAASFSEKPSLQKLVEKLILISSNVLKAVTVPKQIDAASTNLESDVATEPQETAIQEEDTAHQTPENQIEETPLSAAIALNPVSISCEGTSAKNTTAINSLMDRLTPIMQEGSPIVLTHLTTGLAKQILPRIRTLANGSQIKVLERVEVSNPCFKKGITKLVTVSFGNNVSVV